MEDINIGAKPYKKGDRLIVEIIVTDEDKSFEFLGKSVMGKLDTQELGFEVDKISFWKDRYINNIPFDLRKEIIDTLQRSIDEIKTLTGV